MSSHAFFVYVLPDAHFARQSATIYHLKYTSPFGSNATSVLVRKCPAHVVRNGQLQDHTSETFLSTWPTRSQPPPQEIEKKITDKKNILKTIQKSLLASIAVTHRISAQRNVKEKRDMVDTSTESHRFIVGQHTLSNEASQKRVKRTLASPLHVATPVIIQIKCSV